MFFFQPICPPWTREVAGRFFPSFSPFIFFFLLKRRIMGNAGYDPPPNKERNRQNLRPQPVFVHFDVSQWMEGKKTFQIQLWSLDSLKRTQKENQMARSPISLARLAAQFSVGQRGILVRALWSKMEKNTDKIAIESFTVPRVSGASKQANGRASGPVL